MTARIKSAQEYADQINELVAEAEGIMAAAAADGREMNDEEQARVDEIQATVGEPASDNSEATGLWLRHDQAAKRETFIAKSKARLDSPRNEGVASRVAAAQVTGGGDESTRIAPVATTRKLVAFDNREDAQAAGHWIRAVIARDQESMQWCADHLDRLYSSRDNAARFRAVQTGGTNSAGGFTVPDPLAAALIAVRERAGVSRRLARIVTMPSDTFAQPKRASGLTVYYPGEASAITLSDMVFAQVSLAAVKRATLTKISNELLRDSLLSVADEVAMDAGHALAYQEDNELINGDGSGTYGGETGLLSALGAAGKFTLSTGETAWSNVALTDFNATKGKVAERFVMDGAQAWIMKREFYFEVVEKLIYAAGGNTATSLVSGVPGPSLFGEPIYFTEHMPADSAGNCAALYGNFREAVMIGDRDMVEIATSEHYAFNEDVVTLRSTVRYDINVHESAGSSATSAYAGLFLSAT